MINTWSKKCKRWIGRTFHQLSRCIIRVLPLGAYRIFAELFFILGYLVMLPKRRLVLLNLRIAFGREKTKEEIRQIASRYFRTFGRGMIDFIYFRDRPQLIQENIRIEGREYLDAALAQGKGVIFTGGHFGNFLLMYWKLAAEGYKINVIMRRAHDSEFEDIISDIRKEAHVHAIYDLPARDCVVQCLKCLRHNEVLFILLDQNYGGSGRIFVDFFGQKAATASGPVVFSLRTQSPILPIFCLKDEGELKHKIIIEPPLELVKSADEKVDMKANVQTITKIIERYARQNPHEWGGWAHKRWKSKPLQEQEIIDRLKGQWKAPV